jgi:hypothetical protein
MQQVPARRGLVSRKGAGITHGNSRGKIEQTFSAWLPQELEELSLTGFHLLQTCEGRTAILALQSDRRSLTVVPVGDR